MFEFLESKANDLIDSINSTANGMSSDSEAATTQATDNESQASQLEAQATAEEESCPHYKDERYTETETDTTTGEEHEVTRTRQVPDPAADASSRAKASSLRAQAATLKAAAAALRALASALRAQLEAMKAQRQKFAEAVAEVNQKISDTTQKLGEGTSLIVGVISSFSVPIVSGAVNMVKNTANSILGNVGIDLSDGFDEKDVYGLTGWIAKTTVDTGAFAVKTFISTTVASTLGGGMIGTTGAFVVGKVVGPTIDEAFGEKAVDGVHTFFTSALEFLGIKAKPDEKETATAGTEEVETILKGDKADINTGKNGSNTVTENQQAKLSSEQLANEILSGKWGNGNSRKEALRAAGYTDSEISEAQKLVNKGISYSQQPSRTASEIMNEDNKKGQAKTDYYTEKGEVAKKEYEKYDGFIKDGYEEIKGLQRTIKENQKIYDQNLKKDASLIGGQELADLYNQRREIEKENKSLEARISRINTNIEAWEENRKRAEDTAKQYGVKI